MAALAEAAADPATAAYGPIRGEEALRAAFAAETAAVYGARVGPEAVAITAGCNQAFVMAMMAIAGAGDEVILPAPWYFNHKMALDMMGMRAVPLPCRPEDGFAPDAAAAERLISPRTRAIVLVTPNNPTGAIYPPAVIAAFAAVARRRGLWLVLDETYRDFLPDPGFRPHGLFAQAGGPPEDVVHLYSFSKAFALPDTGWARSSGRRPSWSRWARCWTPCRSARPASARSPSAGPWDRSRDGARPIAP